MSDSNQSVPDAVLSAKPRGSWLRSLIWLLPVAALAGSVAFTWLGMRDRGPLITIHAGNGYGVGAGDAVRYRGIDVGIIKDVNLGFSGGEEGVHLEVQMRKEASDLARAGTKFWIVRPQLSLDSVEGLETIIGARYIALNPGPEGAERRMQFTALPEPPLREELVGDRGLEIVLEAPTRFGLQPGAALTYRGVRIGTVLAVGLASDATSVEVRALVRSAFTQLVRERSVFWETGGFELGLSLTGGLEVDLDSLRTALVGGIAMATPVNAGDMVSTGSRFRLHADAEDDWLDWAPALPLGSDLLPPGSTVPHQLRAALNWVEGRILRSKSTRVGWMLVTPDGLVGPADLLTVPEDARTGKSQLQVAGQSFALESLIAAARVTQGESGGIATLSGAAFGEAWPGLLESAAAGVEPPRRTLLKPEDLVVFRGSGRDPIGIDAARLTIDGAEARIDRQIPVGDDWHGAVAVARSDGAVVGLLRVGDDRAGIIPLP